MRIDVHEEIDGVNFHAETEGVEQAREFLKFLGELRTEVKGYEPTSLAGVQFVETPPQVHTPSQVKAQAKGGTWTRENLQSVVVALVTSKREQFAALLQQFDVARFRDLPDDKLNDFGVACAGLQQEVAA